MVKEEVKQYIRNLIDYSIKNQCNGEWYDLCYNKSYLRALKLSKIIGKPVDENNFKGGEQLFHINTKYKAFWYHEIIYYYLIENYTTDYENHKKIIEEILNEYEEYKDYKYI